MARGVRASAAISYEEKVRPSHQACTRTHPARPYNSSPRAKFHDGESRGWHEPSWVAYCRAVLREVLNDAMRFGLLGRNVAALVKPPAKRTEVKPLAPLQARRLLEVA